MNGCCIHNLAKTMKGLEEFRLMDLPHPPYSPDISPCDLGFFGRNKDVMQGHTFHGIHHMRAYKLDLLHNVDPSTLISVYHEGIERLEHAMVMNGEYYFK
jgi:histone-lysine N-methyltransferase SETMAR